MIYGIGIDIVNISRIQSAVERWGEGFLNKIFTDEEIEYCYKKKVPFPSLAVRFAAKEALIKSLGNNVSASLKNIEVGTSKAGKPFMVVHGHIKAFFEQQNIAKVHLSLSHERDYGIASVLLERGG